MLLAVFGVSCVWADGSIEINTTNSGVTGSYADKTFDVNDVTFGFTQWMKSTNIQAKKSTTNSCYNVDAIPGNIKKITVVQTGTARAIKMYGGTSSKPTTEITAPSTAATMEFDFTGKEYTYFSMTTPGNAVYINTITITYEAAGGDGGGSTPEPTTYTVSIANNITGGTVTANPTTAAANATVTLTATPATGYEFGAWDVKDASNNTITVTDNKFTMPAANVTVSATFNAKATRPENEIFYESFDTNDGTGGNDDKWSGSIATNDIKQDNEGWVYAKGNGANKCAKFGAGSSLGSATTPALGQACDATLTFKAAAWNGNSENTTLKLSVIDGGTISHATVTMTKGAWNTFTVTLTSLTADSKVKFEGNSSSNSRFFLDEVSVVKTGNATPVKAVTSIAVKTAPTKVAYTEGDKFAPAGLVITATYNIGAPEDIAYAGNESKFSFEPSLSTALTAENTFVTITYGGKTATQAISVEAFSIANTQETAYTVAEAIALIDAGKGLATPVYVKGTVSEVVTAFNASYGNISVNISADGETTGAQFQLYRNFKGAENEKWTSATEAPEVGDQVVAYGTLTKHNTTYEMAEGNYVVSITKKTPVEPTVYTITVNEYIQNGSVSVSATSAEEGTTITLTATPADDYELEEYIVTRADNNVELNVTDNKFTMPAANVSVTATFKAVTGGEPTPDAGEGVTYTFANFTSGNDVTLEADGYTIILHKNTGSTAPQWNGSANEARVYAKGSVDIVSSKNIIKVVYDYAVNANNKGNKPTIDGVAGANNVGSWNAETKTWTGSDKNVTLTTSGTAGNLGFKSITVYFEEETPALNGTLNFVATNEDGYWATFSCTKDVIFDANDVIVYTVAVDNNELVTIDASNNSLSCVTDKTKDGGWVAGYYVQAGAAVLINAVDASVNYYFIDTDEYTPNQLTDVEAYGECNMLRPASVAMTGDFNFYKLAYDNYTAKSGLGFYWGAENGAAFTCKAGTAYLAVPKSSASNLRGFRFEGEGCTTGIKSIAADKASTEIYNLQGQRISRLQQGVNIVNGKKVVIK